MNMSIPEVARSKVQVGDRSVTVTAVSNTPGSKNICLLRVLCFDAGSCFCDGLVTRPGDFYLERVTM